VRFEELVERLAELPPRLPPAPSALMPVLVPGPDGRRPGRPRFPPGPPRDAAVLVLFHPGPEAEARVVLTERSAGGHRHAGQISFPGGAIDEGESIVGAAIREAHEEVGLRPEQARLEVVGALEPIDVRASAFLVHPVVATAAVEPALVPDEHEVATIISAPVSAFLPGAPIETVTAMRDGMNLRYGAYLVGDHRVWGATARIMGGLGAWLYRE
jgi:8-oxo-dGTP pyrophosphatase MutT (NUDIX family)